MNFDEVQEKQVELMKEYISLLEKWLIENDKSYFDRMNEIKEAIDTISWGAQFHMMLEKMGVATSNIVVPQSNLKLKI